MRTIKKKVSKRKTTRKSVKKKSSKNLENFFNDDYFKKNVVAFDLIKHASDLIMVLNIKGKFVFVNDKMSRFTGLSNKKVVGRPVTWFTKVINPKSIPLIMNNFGRRIKGEKPLPYIIEIKDTKGNYVPLEVNANPIKKGSKIVGVMAILRDVSEREKQAELLDKTKQEKNYILESISDGFFILNNNLVVEYYNSVAEKILGRKKSEVIGKKLFSVFKEAKDSVFEEYYTKSIQQQKSLNFETYFGKKPYEAWYSVRTYPFNRGIAVFFQVITERKLIEESLKEAEERFRLASSIASDLIYEWDIVNDSLNWYGDIDKALGYKKNEFPRTIKAWIGRIFSEDRKKLSNSVALHRNSVKPISEEYRVKKKDGSIRFWVDKGIPVLGENNKPLRWIGICTDITERKKAELLIKKEKEKLQNYFDLAGNIIVSLDKKGNISSLNRKAYTIFGYKKEDLLGKNWFDTCLPKKNLAEVKKVFKKLMKGQLKLVEHYENPIITKKGHERIISWYNSLIKDDKGKITGVLSSGEDITERLMAEKALDQNISLLRSTMESTADGIFVVDLKGNPVFYNERFKVMWNLSDAILESEDPKTIKQFFIDKVENSKDYLSKQKELDSFPEEESFDMLALSDGRVFERHSIPQKIKKEIIGRVWSYRDVTKRKKAEEEIKRRNSDLEKFNKLAVGRELKMIELKKKIRELKNLLLKEKVD